MNLLEIRKQFIKLSGRYDLVADTIDYVDNGANFYINESCRFLDMRTPSLNSEDSAFYAVVKDEYFVEIATMRVLKEVWFYDDAGRVQLEEIPKKNLRNLFPLLLSASSEGIPAVYAPVRAKSRTATSPSDFHLGLISTNTNINAVLFPKVDRSGWIEVVGKFFSNTLDDDIDENYWSIHYPMLLVWAALYHMEVAHRNREGAGDWMSAIVDQLAQIEMDFVEEQSYNVRQLGAYENSPE